jgi:hypothetical protein
VSPARDVVLLVTHSGDSFTVDRVADGVVGRGFRPLRVDTDRFPSQIAMSSSRGRAGAGGLLRIDGDSITDAQVRAVWLRRVRPPRRDDDLDPSFRDECAAESQAAMTGFFDSLDHAAWVDRPERVRAAADKLRQLRIASDVGLRVPETVVSNDPREVRALRERVAGPLVGKLLRSLSTSMEAPARAMYTSVIADADLADLESLATCPMVFQERIAVECELRVAYVAGRCFVGGLRLPAGADPDWRRLRGSALTWSQEMLDATTAAAVGRLMERLGLSFGAIDLVRSRDGELVFLEVNPAGEWGMLERSLGLPIGDAIAGALVAS